MANKNILLHYLFLLESKNLSVRKRCDLGLGSGIRFKVRIGVRVRAKDSGNTFSVKRVFEQDVVDPFN